MKKTTYSIFLGLLLTACGNNKEFRQTQGAAWGTMYHITYSSDKDLADSVVAVMRRVDEVLSPFNSESLMSRINSGESVDARGMWSDVFNLSQRVCRLSSGAFDPTVAPLVNLWGFGYGESAGDMPSDAQIDSALLRVGILDCSISPDGTVARKHPATEFDFSAVAKGYGVDMIAAMLRRNGCTDYMVEVGGEIALSGNGPSGDGWRIQVDAPVESADPVHERLQVLHLTDCGIATSGNYRNFRDTSGGRVGHTISPITGHPVATDVLSATVIAPTCAEADALATALMALPSAEGLAIVESLDSVTALIVTLNADSTYQVTKSR